VLKKELGEGLASLALATERAAELELDSAQLLVAESLTRCIRLLHLQIKILKVDIANHRLSSLYESLSSGSYSGSDYIRGRFREMFDLGPRVIPKEEPLKPAPASLMSSNLPKTSLWLSSSDSLSAAKATTNYVSAFGGLDVEQVGKRLSEERRVEGSAPPQVTMRAGRGLVQPSTSSSSEVTTTLVTELTAADSPEDMLVRHALVSLVAQGAPPSSFPETLGLDVEKICILQNELQGLSVLATCLLLSQSLSKSSQRAVDRSRLDMAKNRLLILLADQNMDLDSLACEIAVFSGDDSAPQVEKSKKALQALLNVDGPAYRSLSRAIVACLFAQVMVPRAQEAKEASMRILGRVGVGIIAEDVEHLSSKLSDFISVHSQIYLNEVYVPLLQQPSMASSHPTPVDEI
jgi:hypothetical protein